MGLERFISAQEGLYDRALEEIKKGKKQSHWMWFIFPQIAGLGHSTTAKFYGIANLEEAKSYMAHPVLSRHLIEISEVLLKIENKTATEILGTPDDMKLRSSMTLFARTDNTNPVFKEVLCKYFSGIHDELTLKILKQ
jgi:uncharacterized protein (DUF1810 family)